MDRRGGLDRRSLLKGMASGAGAAVVALNTGGVTDASGGQDAMRIQSRERKSGAPGREIILGRSDEAFPRHSEGDLTVLPDGRLVAVWSRFKGSSDHAVAELVGRMSEDEGVSWGELFTVASLREKQHRDNSNLMSASLLPLQSSKKTLLLYLGKREVESAERSRRPKMRCSIFGRFTSDGRRYSAPSPVSDFDHYYVVNNARVIQLSNGRILVPCAVDLRPGQELGWSVQSCLTFYSDDQGRSWRRGNPCSLSPQQHPGIPESRLTLQEPGLLELNDGRVFMVIRTLLGHPYMSRSEDGGENWSTPEPIQPLVSPASPQTLFRLPGSRMLALVYNNNPKGAQAAWAERRPLAFAVSGDEGKTFEFKKVIEEKEHYCWSYPACRLHGQSVLLACYEWIQGNPGFFFTDFKLSIIPVSWFES